MKTIGLLTLFGNIARKIDTEFLRGYAKLSLNVKNPESILQTLQKQKISIRQTEKT
ncbi:MAG: hypothetical protein H7A23_24875 [Leptospiraceae bacterium]|nr:hypothetical protein [Leptospiraceae bacterium]MCP5497800.1 hypothetical protein [Leptospiraceae bacterium]